MEWLRRHAGRIECVADEVGELEAVAGLADPLGHFSQRERFVEPAAASQVAGQVRARGQAGDGAGQVRAEEQGTVAFAEGLEEVLRDDGRCGG